MSCSAIFILSSVYIIITSVWLGGFLSPKCLHYGENISVSFNLDLLLRYPCILGRHVVGIAEIKSTICNLITPCNYIAAENGNNSQNIPLINKAII